MKAPERIMVLRCTGLFRPGLGASAPGREAARVFERVLAAVTAFCPAVEVTEPGVCAFGARGPARYFGGETALATRIIAAVAELGVKSVIQPGGSKRDAEVIAAADEHGIAMVFTGMRHFRH